MILVRKEYDLVKIIHSFIPHIFIEHCYASRIVPPKDTLKSYPPVPQNIALFGYRVRTKMSKLKSDQ